ncbi:hypothetical protein K3495_g994 [Podosphaera aphanis]|nr:hypothetical protein K3495_g994 [Podosphaera aphanis]
MSSYIDLYPLREIDPCVIRLQKIFSQFYSSCHICNADLKISEVEAQIEFWRERAQQIPPLVPFSAKLCPNGHLTCVGCGNRPKFNEKHFFTSVGVINQCCELGQLFGIWCLIARIDNVETFQPHVKPIVQKRPTNQKGFSKSLLITAPGVGYASDAYSHYNHLSSLDTYHQTNSEVANPLSQNPATYDMIKDKDSSKDCIMIETLKLLNVCLYPSESPTLNKFIQNLDIFFRTSTLLDLIIDYLRNDSVDELTQRAPMILEICRFLGIISKNPALVGLLLDPWPRKKTSGIVKLSQNSDHFDTEYTILDPCSASLLQATTNTYQQLKTYLELTNKGLSPGGPQSTNVCKAIIQLYESLKAVEQKRNPVLIDLTSENVPLDAWKIFAENNRVTFTDETLVSHKFTVEFSAVLTSNVKHRLNKISKEVATLTTSLPPGIFLKVAESRIDVMKVLIVGSEGSPYAGGLFIFDIFLPGNYPFEPPKIKFVLNGNDSDRHSFNPNLHRGGTVCLSILNTWHGSPNERWQPNKSTVLSVLISIQAMILGAPIPWFNEPGREVHSITQIAIEHKHFIQGKTIKFAMLEWIQNLWIVGTKEYIWKDICQMYWKHHGHQVFRCVKEWSVTNSSLENYGLIARKPVKKARGAYVNVSSTLDNFSERRGDNLIQKLANSLGIKLDSENLAIKQASKPQTDGKRNYAAYYEGSIGLSTHGSSSSGQLGKAPFIPPLPNSGPGNFLNYYNQGGQLGNNLNVYNQGGQLGNNLNVYNQDSKKWVYTGGRSQKEVRAACKEFGIHYAPTIKDSILKLEAHVNGKGKMSSELSTKYGV